MTCLSLVRLAAALMTLVLIAACDDSPETPLESLDELEEFLFMESDGSEVSESAVISTSTTSISERRGEDDRWRVEPVKTEQPVVSLKVPSPSEVDERSVEIAFADRDDAHEDASATGIEAVSPNPGEVEPVDNPDPVVARPGPPVGGSEIPANIRISSSYRPDTNVRVDGEVIQAVVSGTIDTGTQVYTVVGDAGRKLEAVLVAPPGMKLTVRHGNEILEADDDVTQRLETVLTGDGVLFLSVEPSNGAVGDYELTIRIGLPDPEPAPSPAPATRKTPSRPRIGPGDIVYLTFDDGPNPRHTPEVLDLLARYGARATFFVVGSLVEKYPDVFQRIVTEGHTVANHTWRHENLAKLNKEEFDETISRTEEILGEHATPCLRPPYAATGSHTREWAAEYGLDLHLWSVSANDWLGLTGEEIADRIVSQVTHGSVVLMHDGGGNRTQTVRGLAMLLDRLSDLDLDYQPLCR